ncbi:carbohydrate binding domain-containing protein [Chitinimonas taiwanensis]|uniref:Fibronectin type 3 domain-containing protein n=1 Tax=Chitinimonas taiwanensis DSM 18899 TaxID=1121279 RepID=A0A1K2HKY7_9NEIS|nr:carbohydrate binding domain-containing protein [Chitinimonas taiwanensis]SFZ77446.1 fibronectin type 3 domain-containing protein [Chitinimonas taiwanensis DSM 18899]
MPTPRMRPLALSVALLFASGLPLASQAAIPAAHVYHNHMPNFWPFYGVDVAATYNATPVGAPIRYTYDGQVINLKNNPPAGYTYFLPSSAGGGIMPHDDLVTYYSHHAKTGAYMSWPMQVANELQGWSGGKGQVHVTMSGAVVNNVQSLNELQNVSGYNNPNWGQGWANTFANLKTSNNFRTLDTIAFTGHHTMGPLVGSDYFLKDLIYQRATLAQPYFLGSNFVKSKGFFPTELGFSDRLIPTLAKLGVEWSVLGNNHYSRTLKDYPFTSYDATGDTLTSPPNRADLRNTSSIGSWVSENMAHEQQVVVNKFPFASTPHWVRYVDPASGTANKIAGIPVSQNGSWEEGWEGSITVDEVVPYQALEPRQFFVIAHDGDNSSGRAGSLDTWQAGYNTTCSGNGYCLGIDEYLKAFPIPANDVAHVQDGSWIDTRDSSSDPTWYHWRLPFLIWKGQFAAFNAATGMNLAPKTNLKGQQEGATVSLEYGWHYLERNFALLQAAQNYAKTAEQIWLDANPNHWSPSTSLDNQITYPGNQLNPWMLSYPVKGNAANNYAGGANPAELAWYFLLPAMDSGFGYYDENRDDSVKPTLAFNNSLAFSKPYVSERLAQDRTGPSVWWPQRYPYNPGSVNGSKAEGWTVQHFSRDFAIYTYAFDASGIASAKVKVRVHASNNIDASDDTYKLYDPAAHVGKPGLSVTPSKVGAWQEYPMQLRDLRPDMNGVAWNPVTRDTLAKVPAQEIGNLYYSYLSNYRNQLLDYYIEMTDSKGNVTRSEIQQVFVGAGTYSASSTGSGYLEDMNGTVQGVYPFLRIDTEAPSRPGAPVAGTVTDSSIALSWSAASDNIGVSSYRVFRHGSQIATVSSPSYIDSGLSASTSYIYTVVANDAAGNSSALSPALTVSTQAPDTLAPTAPGQPVAGAVSAGSVSLSWTAASDNYGVAQYAVLRNGVQIGLVNALNYTDNTVQPSSSYSYTVVAIDAAGNRSPASNPISVSTPQGNLASVYYKPASAWSSVKIHFQPTGGSWTTAPGVDMSAACSGWFLYSANLGAASGLNATFNNGAGSWDNNAGANYALGSGISAVTGGSISTSSPCVVDSLAPTQPGTPVASSVSASSVSLSWAASSDTVGVSGYKILRNGVQIGTSATASYTDSSVAASSAYSYTVQAYDAAGNQSTVSGALSVNTPAGNAAKVYYKLPSGWSSAYIHYQPTGGSWTTVPGLAMTAACTGWRSATLNLGSASGLVAAFNNGSGSWANNGGNNYSLGSGVSQVNGSAITVGGDPCGPDTQAPSAPSDLISSNASATAVSLLWVAASDNVGVSGYRVYRNGVEIGQASGAFYSDSTVAASSSYSYTVKAFDAAGNLSPASNSLSVTTPAPGCQVAFSIANAATVTGQTLYVVGNQAALGSWTPAAGFALAIQGSGANVPWTGTLALPAGSTVQYKYVKWNGSSAVWEGNQATNSGNRELSTPTNCNGLISRSDGNFKF